MDTSYKSGIFLTYQLLDALYRADAKTAADSVAVLCGWCADNNTGLSGQAAFLGLYDPLVRLLQRLDAGETVSMREYNGLRSPLVELLSSWMDKVKMRLFLQDGTPSPAALGVHKDIPAAILKGSYDMIPNTDETGIHVLLAANAEVLVDTAGKIVAIITVDEMLGRARYCYPVDSFDYDRLYLSGKLKSLSSTRNDVVLKLIHYTSSAVLFYNSLFSQQTSTAFPCSGKL